jgi:hypothetical protein
VVSSRVAGRVHSVVALPDMISEAGDEGGCWPACGTWRFAD